MRAVIITAVFLTILYTESLSGQCPAGDSLWKRISSIRTSPSLSKSEQLNQLLRLDQQIKNCPPQIDSAHTFLQLSIGVICFKEADYVHAIQYTTQALKIIEKNRDNPAINKTDLIRYYYYLSIYYDSLKLLSKKNEAIDSCISNEMKANTDYHFTCLVLQDNVIDLYDKGDYNLCIDRSALGEALIHKYYTYTDSLNQTVFFICYRANSLRSLRRFNEEEQFLQSKSREFAKIKNTQYQGDIYSLFGYLSESKGNYQEAIAYFKKAYDYNKLSANKDISATVLNHLGSIYSEKLDQNRLALQYYRKALFYARNKVLANANASDSFYILGNIANVYAKMKSFDSAHYFYQKAFDKIKKGIDENDLVLHIEDYVTGNTAEAVVKLVSDKADTYLHEYEYSNSRKSLQQALNIYRTADHLLNGIKTQQTEMESKLFWRSHARHLYEHAVEASCLAGNPEDAFYFFEKSRAVLLGDQLNEQSRISEGEIVKQAGLKREILMLKRKRSVAGISPNEYIEFQKAILANEQELGRMKQANKKSNNLNDPEAADTSFITLQAVRDNLLKDHQALLELFEGDSAVYELLVTKGSAYFNKISKPDFDSTARNYTAYISDAALLNRRFAEYVKTANHLYQLIFFSHAPPVGRIIISPDGYYFPFEALVQNTSHTAPVYFLNDHAVSYTYSARYLMNDFSLDPARRTGSFLGVAPVRYAPRFSLAELGGSDLSLNQIRSYFQNAGNLTGSQATRSNFMNEFSKYNIIQLYTHAADSSNIGEPVIYFADSALYLSDLIADNKPLTRLVVLSACETGSGKLYQGEGVFSFSRAFASIGIPAAITNLWSVDNHSTYGLTELFYRRLSQGLPVDIALQQAKIQFFQKASGEKKLPYYWAATIVAGKTDVLVHDRTLSWQWEVLILLTITLTLFLGWRMTGRKKNN
jgi:CHAT domain-containing protein/tetratricopeptide (TPR) repeat protein